MSQRSFGNARAGASLVAILLLAPQAATANDVAAGPPSITEPIAANSRWCLRLPQDGHIVYRGVGSFDEAGVGTASFLYPAPNAGGLLVAVITHGILVEASKKSQKENLQAAADRVLAPYKVVLDNFKYRDLMQLAVKKTSSGANASLIEAANDPGHEMIVESTPVFSLTQDQKAIVLDNAIVIRSPDAAERATYRNSVRVVSTTKNLADPTAFWIANDGQKLKDESAQLVAESLDIAFHDRAATAPDGEPYRTIRYRQGTSEKIERAQVLSDQCNRLLIRTLRGTLMSVPASRPEAVASVTDHCGDATGPN